jgi:type IV pilus assembly protein PilY1
MADINNSYDTDQLPGSYFPLQTGGGLAVTRDADDDLNVSTLATTITANEPDVLGSHFIGQSAAEYDGSPLPKTVADLGQIRGLAPEEPTKQGGYYAASVAYHGLLTDANPRSTQNVQTFAVALASPLPQIKIPVGTTANPKFVTLVPFAKSVKYNANGILKDRGQFQPTNQIVDFYVENIAADQRSGTVRVNFEDVEAGNDHDMDAIVRYSYRVLASGNVEVNVSSDYQAGGIIHHIGYVISGVDNSGVYLVVQDCNHTGTGTADANYSCNTDDVGYFLDTPGTQPPYPNNTWDDSTPLKGYSSRTFSPSTSGSGATLMQPPLWYAAKWGGFKDSNDNNIPDEAEEWDENGDGDPDNYFLVTNALTLSQQLRQAFNEIINRSSSASAASVNSGAISTNTRIYQAKFDTENWTGDLFALGLNANGTLNTTPVWSASGQIPTPANRKIYTLNSDNSKVEFKWDTLDATRKTELDADPAVAERYVNFIRGVDVPGFRDRTTLLGDIVSSAPMYVGAPRGRFSDRLEDEKYSEFFDENRNRDGIVYVGANDGMLHAFKADHVQGASATSEGRRVDDRGEEVFAYVPKTVIRNLGTLTQPSYEHRYFVDGSPNTNDAFINGEWRTILVGGMNLGGQGVYAINITDPSRLGANSVMWEINDRTSEEFRDLGYTYSQPATVRLHDGSWGVVFGNGYNNTENDGVASTTGNGVLYIVDAGTGQLLRKFDTGRGMAQDPTRANRPNGLTTPTMVDVEGDRIVDYAYAGDLFGNVWKIDLRSEDPDDWDFAFESNGSPQPFFVASDGGRSTDADPVTLEIPAKVQPITSRIEVARGRYGVGAVLLFGTGKFLEGDDKMITPRADQSFYALFDALDGQRISGRSELTRQTIEDEYSLGNNLRGRQTSNRTLTGKGWYLDLVSPDNGYEGERVVTNPIVRDDRVIFNTLIPNTDPCGYGGRSWTMVLDLLSGSRLPDAQYDSNGDGRVDQRDNQNVSGVTRDDGNGGIQAGVTVLTCTDTGMCDADKAVSPSTDGTVTETTLRTVKGARGRQSWRQIR